MPSLLLLMMMMMVVVVMIMLQIPVYVSNPDLVFSSKYPEPRLAQGGPSTSFFYHPAFV